MAFAGKRIEHPVAGEHALFLQTASDTGGELLQIEVTMNPKGFVTVEHTHPLQEETFEILKGEVFMTVHGDGQVVRAGERRVVPAGVPHVWRNHSDTAEAKVRVEFRPALKIEYLFENVAGLAKDGKVDPKSGLPNLLQTAILGRYYADDMRMTRPPWWLQRVLFAVLCPIAWLAGYRPKYPQYTD